MFSLREIVVGEIAYGVAIGWFVASIRKRIEDSSTETIVTLITPFLAYLVPAWLRGSGVLATVATGMYIGVQQPELCPRHPLAFDECVGCDRVRPERYTVPPDGTAGEDDLERQCGCAEAFADVCRSNCGKRHRIEVLLDMASRMVAACALPANWRTRSYAALSPFGVHSLVGHARRDFACCRVINSGIGQLAISNSVHNGRGNRGDVLVQGTTLPWVIPHLGWIAMRARRWTRLRSARRRRGRCLHAPAP